MWRAAIPQFERKYTSALGLGIQRKPRISCGRLKVGWRFRLGGVLKVIGISAATSLRQIFRVLSLTSIRLTT
jgi:hypothetical protein